jgi:hypothetical protein
MVPLHALEITLRLAIGGSVLSDGSCIISLICAPLLMLPSRRSMSPPPRGAPSNGQYRQPYPPVGMEGHYRDGPPPPGPPGNYDYVNGSRYNPPGPLGPGGPPPGLAPQGMGARGPGGNARRSDDRGGDRDRGRDDRVRSSVVSSGSGAGRP